MARSMPMWTRPRKRLRRRKRPKLAPRWQGIKVFTDFKKWQAARLAPQRWGEKSNVTITTAISDDPVEMAKRVAFLEALQGPQEAEDKEKAPE